MSIISIALPVTTIKLFNRENNSIFEVQEMGKLNLKSCREIAKAQNAVLISKDNTVKKFDINTKNLTNQPQ